MKLTVFHDAADEQGREILRYLRKKAEGADLDMEFCDLSQAEMEPCAGCFSCWLKTPGICIFKDDAAGFLEREVNSDRILYLCPVTWGGYSPALKILQDRSLGRVLPFFHKVGGETHHPPRYGRSPEAFLAGYGTGLTEKEEALFLRTGQNLSDNIHKGGPHTVIIREADDFSRLNRFLEGGEA